MGLNTLPLVFELPTPLLLLATLTISSPNILSPTMALSENRKVSYLQGSESLELFFALPLTFSKKLQLSLRVGSRRSSLF